jgi:hypothetical protein
MDLSKITTRKHAVELVYRIAERFFHPAGPWHNEALKLPTTVRRRCKAGLAHVKVWWENPTEQNRQRVEQDGNQLQQLKDQQGYQLAALVSLAVAACGCVVEDNWLEWVDTASFNAPWYLTEIHGPTSNPCAERDYQIIDLAVVLECRIRDLVGDYYSLPDLEHLLEIVT